MNAPVTLESTRLFDADGAEVRVAELHAQGPVVLIFVRYFGCLFCKQQVAEVVRRRSEFQAAGVDPIVIGQGTVEQAREFSQKYADGMRVLTDPDHEAFCAAGMKRGVSTLMSFGVLQRAARAVAQGFMQTSLLGDSFQQGGVVVLDRDGRVLYRFLSEEAGLHAPLDDVLAAL